LEADARGEYQLKEKLGEVGLEPTEREMATVALSQGEVEQELSNEIA